IGVGWALVALELVGRALHPLLRLAGELLALALGLFPAALGFHLFVFGHLADLLAGGAHALLRLALELVLVLRHGPASSRCSSATSVHRDLDVPQPRRGLPSRLDKEASQAGNSEGHRRAVRQ